MTSFRRVPELDGVRGCAIALVLSWHFVFAAIQAAPATTLSYAQAVGRLTWSGVDLFFVLSGHLIGGILIDSRDSQNYFRTFYTRRFYRIVPLYSVLLFVALIANRGIIDPHIPTLTYFVFLQNFWMARFATFGMLLAATWSLAVEEQFYLTLPAVVRLTSPKYVVHIIAAGVLVAPCLRIFLLSRWPQNPFLEYVLMPCRADALLLGVLGALAIRNPRTSQWLQGHSRTLLALLLCFVAGAGLLTKYAVSWGTMVMQSVGYTWLAALYLCGILYVLTQPQSRLARIMRQGWLAWLGSIAYGVYLTHQMIGDFVFRTFGRTGGVQLRGWGDIVVMFAAVGVTLVICRVSWLTFEKPLLKLGHRQGYGKQPEELVPQSRS